MMEQGVAGGRDGTVAAVSRLVRGRVHKYGDDLTADGAIMPFHAVRAGERSPEVLGSLVLTPIDPDFPNRVRPGDVLVTGRNFGAGKSHVQGLIGLRALGLGAIVAESMSRGYFRKAITYGLPAMLCPGISALVEDGDPIEIDLETGAVTNRTSGRSLPSSGLPGMIGDIVRAGGLTEYLRRDLAARTERQRAAGLVAVEGHHDSHHQTP